MQTIQYPLIFYLLRCKAVNNTELQYTHSVVFSLHFKLQNWKDLNKEEMANREDFPYVPEATVFSPFLDLLHFSLSEVQHYTL